jgi:hypothetical protein
MQKNGIVDADIKEAEMLARNSVCIVKELYGPRSTKHKWNFGVLVDVLRTKGDYGDETKSLLEDYFSDSIKYHGIDSNITASAHRHFGSFNFNITHSLVMMQ